MPYVNIKVTKENGGLTKEEKHKLIKGVTDLLEETLHKNPASTVVVIDEIDMDNYGLGAEQISDRRKRGQ
ncbi:MULTISPECIES: tautomerase family protein [Shouchella]|uniref:Tautomerase n=3 Tax=Bacillaceae TaxID=186817 RepID=A0A060M660_9BACI|nr:MULTISPECIES: 4-oxalocrotonate tautomerase family protein [Bacillaceae]RQW18667.1 4-oxalocrotonate tautomerase family protein [Bacillus sp. C1-1]AIC96028.1 tautomerase [Shouchella lehensis G1]KQL56061.1 tautomerase [Alkalicoccobacillus plakortidis]MBG9784969.1 tautomerase [Shouchella lehensis]TES46389.1 4-oxalocrotonate tautomerase family protein [Shouchella lehensis]